MLPPQPPVKVCAVCGRVLDHIQATGEYVHSLTTPHDHPAVPVDEGEVPTVGKCDFCFAPDPDFTLPTHPFNAGLGMAMDDEWSCCSTCAAYLRQNQWTRLFGHVKASWEERHGGPMPPEMDASLRRLYRQIRQNVRGDVRALQRPGR